MNEKTQIVLKGFLNLSKSEKEDLYKLLKDYDKYPITTEENLQKSLTENFRSHGVNLGPAPSSCPCCGK